MAEFEVFLQGGSPWGFRLQGGKEFRVPLRISKIEHGGKADIAGIKVGDEVTEINEVKTETLYHTEALTAVKRAHSTLSLVLLRNENEVHITTTVEKTRSVPSSPTAPRSNSDNIFVPGGQGYMKKIMAKADTLDFDDLPPMDRERSKTLPKKSTLQHQSASYDSNSLPRKSTSNITNKAPDWYKQMYKDIHKSMEGESHLSKLLSTDAQRGAFRKYDGVSTNDSERRTSVEEQTKNVPRRLQGGGRSIAKHPNRKSLPNIHASNFNFMNPNNTRITDAWKKPENRKSINSDFYRQLQKGGDVPVTGLAAAKSKESWEETVAPKKETKIDYNQTYSYLQQEKEKGHFIAKQPSINTEYNKPPDFLELRKLELKNRELEKEREELREKRERERTMEEEKLKRQAEEDRLRIAKEQERIRAEDERERQRIAEKERLRKAEEERLRKMEEDILKSQDEVDQILAKTEEQIKIEKYGRAKYSFHPQGVGELEFKKGDTIHILQAIDQNWLEGEVHGEIGIFPCTYVEILEETVAESKPIESKLNKTQTHAPVSQKKAPVVEAELTPMVVKNEESMLLLNLEPAPVGKNIINNHISEEVKNTPKEVNNEFEVERKIVHDEVNNEIGLARAKYTFRAETESELAFKKGQHIYILRKIDDNWYEGELDGNIGILPVPYVEILNEAKSSHTDYLTEAIRNVENMKQTEKTKISNERVHLEEKRYNGFTNGDVDTPYHDENDNSNELVGTGQPYEAVYNYKATNEDEVELLVGDHVHVLEKCDDGWFVGTCQRTGAFGTFPGNYVVPLS